MDEQNDHAIPPGEEEQRVSGPPPQGATSSWRPADYYASTSATSTLPRWVPISCGVAAIIVVVLMFAVGVFLRQGGLASVVALAIGQFQGELKQMLAEDVSAEAKERLDASLRDVRERLTAGDIEKGSALQLLQEIQKVSSDRTITSEEVDRLQAIADEITGKSETEAEPIEL